MIPRMKERDIKVVLHGALRKFGGVLVMNAATPAQAIRGISCQLPEFAKMIKEGTFRVVLGSSVRTGAAYTDKDFEKDGMFFWSSTKDETLHIIPAIHGAGSNGGVVKAVVGAIILIAAVVLSYGAAAPAAAGAAGAGAAGGAAAGAGTGFALSATAFTVLGTSVTYGSIALFGAALMFSGIASMTAPSMKSDYSSREAPDQRASFMFNGPVNTTQQGGCVPVVYGICRTGSFVISAGLEMRAM